ncbi:MAG TPA: hypothetical protein VE623_01895 [Acidimicrobiales bacterium]|jgi:hypothetical protein|nr:hypothetical protein [Acidimicrobiales bacterium]
MQRPADRTPAPRIEADQPPPDTRRHLLILAAVVLALAIGVALHVSGIVGPG